MRLRIRHTTRYTFDSPATYGLQQLRKTPKSSRAQEVLSWQTSVEGGRKELSYEDYHNNLVELVSFERDTVQFTVKSEGEVEVTDTHGIIGPHIGYAPLWLFKRITPLTRPGPEVKALLRDLSGDSTLDKLHALNAAVGAAVRYETGVSNSTWTAEEALAAGHGVCQDHAHVFLAGARELGVPARYVSGYLMLDDRIDQNAMHAWTEAHVQGLGWVGFDPANAISPDMRYIRVATGLDYGEAAPVTGSRQGGTGETLAVEIEVAQQ